MDSLKTFDIRLTDIWIDCQKELIEMKGKIVDLKTCLRTSEQINKHLIKCNEVLVAIIEKCKIDNKNNKGMNDLIKTIKREEECIEVEKQNLKKIKDKIHNDFSEGKVIELITDWNDCKSPKTSKRKKSIDEKSTQTLNNYISIDSNRVNNEKEVNIDLDQIDDKFDIKPNFETIEENADTFDEIRDFDENDNRSDGSVKSDDFDINDNMSDSDFDTKTPKKKAKKSSKSPKSSKSSKSTSRTERINDAVLPYCVGNQYVCTQEECHFVSSVKRQFYRHLRNEHKIEGQFKPREPTDVQKLLIKPENCGLSAKVTRINDAVLPYQVGEDFVCTKEGCRFTCKARAKFYNHLREHDPRIRKHPREERSNNSERPYLCDWPSCGMAFRRPQHLSIHRKRHMGVRDFVCDWPGCGAEMYTAHNYYTHRLTHTDERPWKCDWPGCPYSCKQKWALVAHKRIHTGEKPYLCPFPECGYRCAQPCTLVAHKRKHTGEKPYTCEVKGCNKQFSALAGIWAHRKIHAKNETLLFSLRADERRAKINKPITRGRPKKDPKNEDEMFSSDNTSPNEDSDLTTTLSPISV